MVKTSDNNRYEELVEEYKTETYFQHELDDELDEIVNHLPSVKISNSMSDNIKQMYHRISEILSEYSEHEINIKNIEHKMKVVAGKLYKGRK